MEAIILVVQLIMWYKLYMGWFFTEDWLMSNDVSKLSDREKANSNSLYPACV